MSTHRSAPSVDAPVIVVGAGPVGLTLALILRRLHVDALVVEQRIDANGHSRAIGVTPPSLAIMERAGLAQDFCRHGVAIRAAAVHDDRRVTARLDFSELPGAYPFILSLPQVTTERLLLDKLLREGGSVMTDVRVEQVMDAGDRVTVRARRADGRPLSLTARYVCGCDGLDSTVRDAVIGSGPAYRYPQSFVMADYSDTTDLAEEAHIFFTPAGSVESFPLPDQHRRWIAQTSGPGGSPSGHRLEELVAHRTGFCLPEPHRLWLTSFDVRRTFAADMVESRVFLAGDAAHTIPPIGGQGMNLGIGDAEHLADLLANALASGGVDPRMARAYARRRMTAARVAGRRSAAAMRIGTIRGRAGSWARNRLISALLSSAFRRTVLRHFAMVSAPNSRSPWRADGFAESGDREQSDHQRPAANG